MTLARACLAVLSALTFTACDTDGDDDGAGAGGVGAGGSGSGGTGGEAAGGEATGGTPCGSAIDCSGHGTCWLVGGLPACTCDDGYHASGLDCVADGPVAPAPPEGFSCPAPGAGGEPLFQQFTANRWYYRWNARTCEAPSWDMLYTFRPDGVFMIQSQFHPMVGESSGSLDYGCYTYAVEGEALRLNYSYSNESTRNCSPLGRLDDPPCSALVAPRPEGGFVQVETQAEYQETHVFRAVTDDACVWCTTAADCCPENGWIADDSGPLCGN